MMQPSLVSKYLRLDVFLAKNLTSFRILFKISTKEKTFHVFPEGAKPILPCNLERLALGITYSGKTSSAFERASHFSIEIIFYEPRIFA
jgi:hypothetical protein